jgi:hypothetical protein
MFEPQAKEDNEGVGKFMTHFVLPFGSHFTVVAALHTKKGGGDPRMRVPPEEMIRGASAWMAHPGQILVLEHDRKSDTKLIHAFGRYEGSTAQGWVIRFDPKRHDYVALGDEVADDAQAVVEGVKQETTDDLRLRRMVLLALGEAGAEGITRRVLQETKVTGRKTRVAAILEELEVGGLIERAQGKAPNGRAVEVWRMVQRDPDMNKTFDLEGGEAAP